MNKNLLFFASLVIWLGSCKQALVMPQNNDYKTTALSLSDVTLYSTYATTIRGKQDVNIFPQLSGVLTNVLVNEGAAVKKGQLLFVIDQMPYIAALEKAKANVANAEAAVATAEIMVESKTELRAANVISDFDLQTARNALRSDKALLAQAKAELLNAQNNLSYTEIKSPVDGVAGMTSFRVGALVNPNMTTPLITVSDNNEMYAYFSISENQILDLNPGSGGGEGGTEQMPDVELQLNNGSAYPLKGKIDAVSGIVDSKTGTVSLRAVFENPQSVLRFTTLQVKPPNREAFFFTYF